MAATALESLIANFTLSELSEKSGKSVSEIVNFAMGSTLRQPAARATAKNGRPAAAPQRSSAGPVNTRTQRGRDDLDARVLDAIRELGTAKADDLTSVGGDIQQRRAALHRLIEAKKIKRTGAARGTTYSVK